MEVNLRETGFSRKVEVAETRVLDIVGIQHSKVR